MTFAWNVQISSKSVLIILSYTVSKLVRFLRHSVMLRTKVRPSSNKKAELSQRRPRDAPNIRVPWKVSRVLTTHLATFPEICNGPFVPIDTKNERTKFEVCSFTCSWDNIVYCKNFGSPWIRPHSLFSPIFKGFLFGWTLWIYLQIRSS